MVSGIKAKVITGSLGLLSASVFGYTIAYPYVIIKLKLFL